MLGLRLLRLLVLWRVRLRVVLVDDARRSRMMQVVRRRKTLLLVVGVMLHGDRTHQ